VIVGVGVVVVVAVVVRVDVPGTQEAMVKIIIKTKRIILFLI